MRNNLLLPKKAFTPLPILQYGLPFIVALVAAMAIISGYNQHPDEHSHILAARYYLDHWLPPAIGDPAAKHTYSVWGHSYLNNWGVEEWLTGKLTLWLTALVPQPLIAVRLFNVFLCLGLMVIILQRTRQHPAALLPLVFFLMTPQAWYVFSYVNDDAFALCLSLLIVSEITYLNSPWNRFLNASTVWQAWSGGMLFGVLLGLLALSKPNYYSFLVFIGLWLVYTAVSVKREGQTGSYPITVNPFLLKKYAVVILIASSIFGARYALDVMVNGSSSFASRFGMNLILGNSANAPKLLTYQEEVASPAFKPSTIKNDLKNSYYGLHLQDKGVSYVELFTQWHWHVGTFKSFVGNYGMLTFFAPDLYYNLMAVLYIAFLAYLSIAILAHQHPGQRVFLGLTLVMILTTIWISTYHSWVNAFQAQGRYLFPVLGMLGLLIDQNRQALNNFVMNAFLLSGFGMSLYSFLLVGIYRLSHV